MTRNSLLLSHMKVHHRVYKSLSLGPIHRQILHTIFLQYAVYHFISHVTLGLADIHLPTIIFILSMRATSLAQSESYQGNKQSPTPFLSISHFVKAILNSRASSPKWVILARFEDVVKTSESRGHKKSGLTMACNWNNTSQS